MSIQREKFKSPLAVACYILIAAMIVGCILGVFAVVPALRNKCIWFTGNCQQFTYQIAPNGTLLVINPATSFMYWYDGQFIYSYGNTILGACSQAVSTGTHTPVQVGAPVPDACLKWSKTESGELYCSLKSTQTSVPAVFDGAPVASGDAFEPVFVLNAYSMQVLPQKTACALSRQLVQNMFKGVPTNTLTYTIPPDGNPLDVYQMFGLMQERGIFVPPSSDTIWYNQSESKS